MVDKSDRKSPPAALQEIALAFRRIGWISLWTQVVLGAISAVILLFAGFSRDVAVETPRTGTGVGIFFALAGVIGLLVSIYWAFRYTRIAKQLQSANPVNRPRKADTVQLLRLGIIVNLIGMLLTIVGAEAIAGTLLAKTLTLPQATGAVLQIDPSRLIRSLDMLVVQANTNTIAAHFGGLVASLWLLNRVSRQ
ncbi:DUF3611 family protein [Chroococcidiopsis sp. CCMEE 29]|jgi:hypothetical protein|uniref:DUF3611 family protein n=1 Tax=Chroococcidiopsis sp. CCMEE 29 TaxID=155894 RepID=UPI002021E7CC|nr:DUF3611 family protein [Chroococcidiopsis sp. CCMEE 29]